MDLTKKIAEAGKALKKAVGAGWLACAAFALSGVALLYHSSGPEGVWLRRALGEVPPLGWLIAVALLIALLSFLLWRVRVRTKRKQTRAAGAQMGMTSLEPVSASSLVGVWAEFRAGFRLQVRREVDRFPVVVVLGAAGSATDDVLRAYAGTDRRAAETLRAVVPGNYLNVHLGAEVVVQELSSALLDEQRGDVGKALRRLWRRSFRRLFGLLPAAVRAPLVAVAVDPSRLSRMSSGEVRSAAVAVRGKLNLLSDICRQPVEVRLLLVELASLPGYGRYVDLVEQAALTTEVSLAGIVAGEELEAALGERFSSFGRSLQLALKSQTTADFHETLGFLQALPALNPSLSLFVRELVRDLRMSDTPDLSVLALTHTTTSPSRFPSNPLRPGERADAAPRGYLLWPHRWLTTAVALGAISYTAVAYGVERSHFRAALSGLSAFPSGLCDGSWRQQELNARMAVRDFVVTAAAADASLRGLPFFASARAPLARKEALLFRDRLLMPAAAGRIANADASSQVHGLFLLGLIQAPGQPELKQLALGEDLPEFVAHTPFDTDSLREYLLSAPAPDLSGLTFHVPKQLVTKDDDAAFRGWLSELNRAIDADPAPDAASLLRLKQRALELQTEYKQLLSWAGEHWLAYDVLDRLEAGQPTDHYRETLPQSIPRTAALSDLVRDRMPLLKLVAGAELPVAKPKARGLWSLIEELWPVLCSAREARAERDESAPSACTAARAPGATRKTRSAPVNIPRVEGDALVETGNLYTSEDYTRMLRDTALSSQVQAFESAASAALERGRSDRKQEFDDDRLTDEARSLLSLTVDEASIHESYFEELKPILREAASVLTELKSAPRAHQHLHSAVKRLVSAWAGSIHSAVASAADQVAQSFPDGGERALATRAAASVRAYGPLLAVIERAQAAADVALDAAQEPDESGLFATLTRTLSELQSKTTLFERDAPAAAMTEYLALLTEISQALAQGEGASAAERFRAAEAAGLDPEFGALLSPAAQLALPMLRGSSDALDVRFATWSAANEPSALLEDMLEAPFRALRRLGQRRLEAVGSALWEVRMRPRIAAITRAFPFARDTTTDVDPKELSDALAPEKGAVSKDYATYAAPLRALSRNLLPVALERSWRRIQSLQALLWTADGAPKPYLVQLTPQPFDASSELTRIEVRSGMVAALPYVNQEPVARALPIDWTLEHDAEITATLRGEGKQRHTEFATAPRSYWALLRLLSGLSLEGSGRDSCSLCWSVPSTSRDKPARVTLRVFGAPFAPFALLTDASPSACDFARRRP